MSSATIAVCCVVRNESRWASGFIDNAKALGDEVYVVDTGSTDDTMELCRSAGAVVQQVPTDDMSEARNAAFMLPSSEWVLMLDADERISRDDVGRLRAGLSSESPECYSIPIHNYVGGGAWATVYSPRLIRRGTPVRWEGAFHETLLNYIARNSVSVEDFHVPIRHLEYLTPDKLESKRLRNIARMQPLIADREAEVHPVALALGALDFFAVGKTDVAATMFKEASDAAPQSFLCNWLYARALLASNKLGDAEDILKRLPDLSSVPRDHSLVEGALADVADRLGDSEDALVKISKISNEVYEPANLLNQASLYFKLGETSEAERCIRASLEADPVNFAPILWNARANFSSYSLQTAQISCFADLASSEFFADVIAAQVPPSVAQSLAEGLDCAAVANQPRV